MVALTDQFNREVCAARGRDTANGRSFMRVDRSRGRLDFCTPDCAQSFNDDPARFDDFRRGNEREDLTDDQFSGAAR